MVGTDGEVTDLAASLSGARASAFRAGVIEFLTRESVAVAITTIATSTAGFVGCMPTLPRPIADPLLDELANEQNWISEHWLRTSDGAVVRVSDNRFFDADPEQRLASNDCIYDIPRSDWHVRTFLSAVRSQAVAAHLSKAWGEPVRCQSSDVARMRQGQYLRRHSDNHEARRFGFVFFLSDGWRDGHGGELIVDEPSGESVVVRPRRARIALIRIHEKYQHNVCPVRSPIWIRYSIAVHYAATTD